MSGLRVSTGFYRFIERQFIRVASLPCCHYSIHSNHPCFTGSVKNKTCKRRQMGDVVLYCYNHHYSGSIRSKANRLSLKLFYRKFYSLPHFAFGDIQEINSRLITAQIHCQVYIRCFKHAVVFHHFAQRIVQYNMRFCIRNHF